MSPLQAGFIVLALRDHGCLLHEQQLMDQCCSFDPPPLVPGHTIFVINNLSQIPDISGILPCAITHPIYTPTITRAREQDEQ
jgi:hypothetical protein